MFAKTAILAAIAATTVSAEGLLAPGAIVAKRDILARQSSGSGSSPSTKCLSELASIYSSMPTPPPELISYTPTNTVTDPCDYSYPNSLSSAFSSYESEAQSWYSENSADISSAISQCPELATATEGMSSVCTAGSSNSNSGSGSGGSDGGSDSGSPSTNGVPKPTGLVAAAAAAAGVLGAVAAL